MRRVPLLLLTLVLSASVSAQLAKYKDWLDSPEANFLTKAERAQWNAVVNDEQAEAFVNAFVAKRGGEEFRAEVQRRAEIAQAFFGTEELNGASTLRGRLLILFGDAVDIRGSKVFAANAFVSQPPDEVVTDLMPGANRRRNLYNGEIDAGTGGQYFRMFTMAFRGFGGNPLFKGQPFVVYVDADVNSGKDHWSRKMSGRDRRKAEAMIEAAIAASIRE